MCKKWRECATNAKVSFRSRRLTTNCWHKANSKWNIWESYANLCVRACERAYASNQSSISFDSQTDSMKFIFSWFLILNGRRCRRVNQSTTLCSLSYTWKSIMKFTWFCLQFKFGIRVHSQCIWLRWICCVLVPVLVLSDLWFDCACACVCACDAYTR